MSEQTTKVRRLKLMSTVKWKGNDNWEDVKDEKLGNDILTFMAWVRDKLLLLPQDKLREVYEQYYVKGESVVPSDNAYLVRFRIALYVLNAYEMRNDGYRIGS